MLRAQVFAPLFPVYGSLQPPVQVLSRPTGALANMSRARRAQSTCTARSGWSKLRRPNHCAGRGFSSARQFTARPKADPSLANKLGSRDRGPPSEEDTQTDFGALNVLGDTAIPSTSIDVCDFDGFHLDSGLRVSDGDGVMLVGAEAFVWRPWMAALQQPNSPGSGDRALVVTGEMLRTGRAGQRTGGVVNSKGQFEISDHAWGILQAVWPKPDLLIIGTGPSIRPLAPPTRKYLQGLGMRLEVLDTRNAASQFNMLATERGVQQVAAALVPIGFGSE